MKHVNMKLKKFATQIDEATLEDLRAYSRSTGRSISAVVSEAGRVLEKVQCASSFSQCHG